MHLVLLTGAGMSAESGLKTFRDADGLWEGHDVYEVASPQGFARDPELVLDFYDQRRRQLLTCEPNDGHKRLAALEKDMDVTIITQNVDDLHERAGSTNVVHLHGELRKVRSILDEDYVIDWDGDLKLGDLCPQGGQLRPHVVWFGEPVPLTDQAAEIVRTADVLAIIGTSLLVYPAAGLVNYAGYDVPKFIIDPKVPDVFVPNLERIEAGASEGIRILEERLWSLRSR